MMIDGVEHAQINVSLDRCRSDGRTCGFLGRPEHPICSHPKRDDESGNSVCSNPPRIWVPVAVMVDMIKTRLTS